jgi:glycosyltransferase involved in cell wall biosynthesis
MKILDFSPYYPPHIGGLEKYAQELHYNLAKHGFEITVFTPNIPQSIEREEAGNIKIIRFPSFELVQNYPIPKFWKIKFWKLFFSLFKEKYDIVFSVTRFFSTCLMAMAFSKIKKTPWIHIEHGSDFVKSANRFISVSARLYDEIFGRLILNLSSLNIAPSESAAHFIKKFTSRKSSVIYRGMPFADIESVPKNSKMEAELIDKSILVFVGRFISGKGIPDLINAINKIKKNSLALILIGYGPEEDRLKQIVCDLKIGRKVLFWGSKSFSEVISILKSSDIFINPSYNEGLPTSVLEAGVCQCAIIATDVGGTREIIVNNQSGILVPPHNTDKLRESIEYLLDNKEKRELLGREAKKTIELKFNWDESIKKFIECINDVAS